jgi:signal peptidase I
VSGPHPGQPEPSWERRLRALDDELASVGAHVDVPMPAPVPDLAPDEPLATAPAAAAGADARPAPVAPEPTLQSADGSAVENEIEADDRDEEAAESETDAAARRRRAVLDWVVVIGVALLVAFLVRTFVLAHFVVDGVSMSSTLHDDDRVFVNKLSYRLHDPNRGDVVVLHQLNGTSERDLIKRVIALPGEEIRVEGCVVYIDGAVLQEPYLDPAAATPGSCGSDVATQVVPADHVFVMGDNRGGSMDSRDLGAISEDDLVGRAFVVFWPAGHWQWL